MLLQNKYPIALTIRIIVLLYVQIKCWLSKLEGATLRFKRALQIWFRD